MKKIIALFVITLSILSFSSCKEDKDTTPTANTYTNISLKDAQKYVGLDYNEAKVGLEAKGFAFDQTESSPDLSYQVFTDTDNIVSYVLDANPETNIVYKVTVSKRSETANNSISNYDFCQSECLAATNNNTAFSYAGSINSFDQEYTSQSEFQNVYNSLKPMLGFCAEGWQSTEKAFVIYFMKINAEIVDVEITESGTTSSTTTYDNYYMFNVSYLDYNHKPITIENKSLNTTLEEYIK